MRRLLSYQLPPLCVRRHSDSSFGGSRSAHPSWLSLWGPHRLPPKAIKTPHLLPQASPQEGQAEASARSPHGLR